MNIDWNCEEAKGKDYCFINNISCAMVFQKYAIPPSNAYFWTLHERPKAEQMIVDWDCKAAEGCDWAVVKVDILEDFSTDLSFSYFKEKPEIIKSKFWALHKRPEVKQMIIDWDCEKAKGKDYCLYYNESNYIFCTQKPINNGECWLVERTPAVRCFTLHERPKAEQMKETIYTKEMHERGQCCEVGMLFETEAGRYKSLFQNETSVVFEDENYFLVAISRGLIKPIDTRTDREKAIDDINYVLMNEVAGKTTRQIAEYIVNKLEYLTFTGDK